jgi:hypothetical protein
LNAKIFPSKIAILKTASSFLTHKMFYAAKGFLILPFATSATYLFHPSLALPSTWREGNAMICECARGETAQIIRDISKYVPPPFSPKGIPSGKEGGRGW